MTDPTTQTPGGDDVAAVKKLGVARQRVLDGLRKSIVGMEGVTIELHRTCGATA